MDFPAARAHVSRSMRRLLLWILPWLCLSCAVFAGWMHLAVLDPTRVGWLLDGNDHGQTAIGLAAFLRAPPPWPSLHSALLMAPEGLSLALTDSNPLLGLILRPFAALLPPGLQFVGPWLFACILLHTGFAAALLRRVASGPVATWMGAALLTLMPVLLARFGHANLCAQWLILWALWIFVDPLRSRQAGWWIAVVTVALLVHPYLLVMVAAIWASAMLRQLVLAPDRAARIGMIGDVALVLAPMLIGPQLLGMIGQPVVATGTYGAYPMALDALWNPNVRTYSALLPARATDPGQALEGMNYLGAGLLLLLIAALAHGLLPRAPGGPRAALPGDPRPTLLGLAPAFAVLTLVAIWPHLIWRGTEIATLPLPGAMARLLDPVRAAGRLFWPALYTIAFAAIVTAYRMRHGAWLLAAALLVQAADLAPLFASARASTGWAAEPSPYHRTRDPRWDMLVARATMIEFEPPEPYRDLALLEEVTWRAILAGRPVRYFYASREPVAVRRRLQRDSLAFAAGEIDPGRLYVLLDGRAPPGLEGRVTMIDGVAVIAPRGTPVR